MSMQLSKDQIERLSFSRYLLSESNSHKNKGRPLSSFTLLILHDLLEIFLQVAIEVHLPGLEKPKTRILDTLSNALNKKLQTESKPLINILYIKKLNDLRNQLKHSTIFVDHITIEYLFQETETFFAEYLMIFFNLNINEISLVALIRNTQIRENLEDAESFLATEKFNNAMISITKSYHYLEQKLVIKDRFGINTFIKTERKPSYTQSFYARSVNMVGGDLEPKLKHITEKVEKDMSIVFDKILTIEKAIAFGINYKRFHEFRSIIPHIYVPSTADKPEALNFRITEDDISKYNYDSSRVQFCLEFMIDTAFKMESAK